MNDDTELWHVVIDSSLLYSTAIRRFLMSLWEMNRLRMPVLPKGQQELYGIVVESEEYYWHARFRKEVERTGRAIPAAAQEAIISQATASAGEWVNEELGWKGADGRADSAMVAIQMTVEQRQRAFDIAERVPMECFVGPSPNNHLGDRTLVGQSIATGFRILATENRKMMSKNRVNAWLREEGLANDDLVLNGDDAIERAGQWREQPVRLLEAALRAALPQQTRRTERENEIVLNLLTQMRDNGLAQTANSCLDAWRGPRMGEAYRNARHFIATGQSTARATEQRRIVARNEAARSAAHSL